jgi:hypothetical protein
VPYPALPDRRMPYDADGTLVYQGTLLSDGASTVVSQASMLEWNDDDYVQAGIVMGSGTSTPGRVYFFFPESREITAFFMGANTVSGGMSQIADGVEGSNDTANGLDGTWETASLPGGSPVRVDNFSWRSGIELISLTGPKKNLRIQVHGSAGGNNKVTISHLYGEAAVGAMTHDLIFIDHDDTPGVEYAAPEDFGDQPLGTTVVRQFRIKNTSASRTATNLSVQCNDADFAIAESGSGPWVATIGIASLAAGAESATLYVRCTTPAPGSALKPRFARIVVTCDSGFFG